MLATVSYTVSRHGAQVQLDTTCGAGTIHSLMPPAQARELAAVLVEMADRVEIAEGVAGESHRAAHITAPNLRYILPALEVEARNG